VIEKTTAYLSSESYHHLGYTIFQTRDEAVAALRARLRQQISTALKDLETYYRCLDELVPRQEQP
jgi:hypothetical protein